MLTRWVEEDAFPEVSRYSVRMGRSRITITTYRPASKKKFHLKPTALMRTPPSRGPASLIEVMPIAFKAMALARSARRTVLATKA